MNVFRDKQKRPFRDFWFLITMEKLCYVELFVVGIERAYQGSGEYNSSFYKPRFV